MVSNQRTTRSPSAQHCASTPSRVASGFNVQSANDETLVNQSALAGESDNRTICQSNNMTLRLFSWSNNITPRLLPIEQPSSHVTDKQIPRNLRLNTVLRHIPQNLRPNSVIQRESQFTVMNVYGSWIGYGAPQELQMLITKSLIYLQKNWTSSQVRTLLVFSGILATNMTILLIEYVSISSTDRVIWVSNIMWNGEGTVNQLGQGAEIHMLIQTLMQGHKDQTLMQGHKD